MSKRLQQGSVLFILLLLVHLPFASALQISNVQPDAVGSTSATVTWQTDEAADSIVKYGESKDTLTTKQEENEITSHSVALDNLKPKTTYYYAVQSKDEIADNSGSLFQFTTKEADTTPPRLQVDLPELAKGSDLVIEGWSEQGAQIEIQLDGKKVAQTQAKNPPAEKKAPSSSLPAYFSSQISLTKEKKNVVTVIAQDTNGNKESIQKEIFADIARPQITLAPLPDVSPTLSLKIAGNVSEDADLEFFVNNRSITKQKGKAFSLSVPLQEGENLIEVKAKDKAGWEGITRHKIKADGANPTIKVVFDRGTEFFEGRAISSIIGQTKPGASVYLYVYKQRETTFTPDFKQAQAKLVADATGNFTFKDVDFAAADFTLNNLAPRKVPDGLQKVSVSGVTASAAQQRKAYYVYIIVEDTLGRTAFWQGNTIVNSCTTGDIGFSISSLPQFQAPAKLNPSLLDQGRQDAQAVFEFSYSGAGIKKLSSDGKTVEQGFKVTSVRVDKACTQSIAGSDEFATGCKLFPTQYQSVPSPDKSKLYVQWNLVRSDSFSKTKDDFWNDFKDRQIKVPLKLTINYQERIGENKWSTTKTQTACYDLGYFVDIPIDSKKLIPDFLANEGVAALNTTVTGIKQVRPVIEQIYYVTGVACISSFLGRTAVRWARIVTAKVEAISTVSSEKKCPLNQDGLYSRSTIEAWKKLSPVPKAIAGKTDDELKAITLEEMCPRTASAWKLEEFIDQAYRWSCDRAFCRAVPAGWTQEKTVDEIKITSLQQQQCAVTGRGVPLQKVENCKQFVQKNPSMLGKGVTLSNITGPCWRDGGQTLYYWPGAKTADEEAKKQKGIYFLQPVGKLLNDLKRSATDRLMVYKPQGADTYFVGRDLTCDQVCKQKTGFKAATPACRPETVVNGKVTVQVKEGEEFAAGYTKDNGCFVTLQGNDVKFGQCVCQGTKAQNVQYADTGARRTAYKKEAGQAAEPWVYRQAQLFTESKTTKGTYYPPERYYTGRDLSGAFGADYLLDYAKAKPETAKVDPHNQIVGTFQTMCLSGILKHLRMLESILEGLRNCIVQAKISGFQDAGMCKTLFSQHVCGLAYKAISYASNSCTPSNFDDKGKSGPFGNVGTIVSEGFKGMDTAIQSSVTDLSKDYGNAKLNTYFKGGTEGFAQSMCVGAITGQWPLFSKDFLIDAAYSTPTKTTALVAPAWRSLSTYNPARQTAVFNYEVGGAVFSGCKIRRATVSLKCIGPEDVGNKGVDTSCLGQGCDCLNIRQQNTPFAGERTRLLHTKLGIANGELYDIKLASPQRIDSHYRYDHVVVELELDPTEAGNVDRCFDTGYAKGNKGVFYYPIKDTSAPGQFTCQADATSGRYFCPQLSQVFGFGGAYLEQPYVSCFNKNTGQYVDCTTPNLFVKNDQIKVKVHTYSDGKGKCLKRTFNGVASAPKRLPDNVPGPFAIEETLGTVTDQLFGGVAVTLLRTSNSNVRCAPAITQQPTTADTNKLYQFSYVYPGSGNLVSLSAPTTAKLTQTWLAQGFSIVNGQLRKGTQTTFTLADISKIEFEIDGFRFTNVLGTSQVTDPNKVCAYKPSARSTFSQGNTKNVQVTYELLELDAGGACTFAKSPVKATTGKASHTQSIVIQKELSALGQTSGMHASFLQANYEQVHSLAQGILTQRKNDLANAVALYYDIAALVKQGEAKSNVKTFEVEIKNLLTYFFDRKYGGQAVTAYPTSVTSTGEYKKIHRYLCEVDKSYGGAHSAKCPY